MKVLHAIVTAILVLFFAVIIIFRLVDGWFESAGARMDRMMGAATDAAVEDIADDIANERDEN